MTTSARVTLASLGVCLALLLFAPDTTVVRAVIFVCGSVAIAGTGFNVIVWILSGYRPSLPLASRDGEDRKTFMAFNKINAPQQNRRDSLVIFTGVALVAGLSGALFAYLF